MFDMTTACVATKPDTKQFSLVQGKPGDEANAGWFAIVICVVCQYTNRCHAVYIAELVYFGHTDGYRRCYVNTFLVGFQTKLVYTWYRRLYLNEADSPRLVLTCGNSCIK